MKVTRGLLWGLLPLPGLAWGALRVSGWGSGATAQVIAFTPYAALGSLLPLGFALAKRRWPVAGLAALGTALLVGSVLPRAFPDRDRGPQDGVRLRVMTANMLAGGVDPETITGLVRDHAVDVLALQEFTRAGRAALTAAGLDDLLPYSSLGLPRTADPLDTTGSALYSRLPLSAPGVHLNDGGFQQAYGTVQLPGGRPVRVESAHALAPVSPVNVAGWKADLTNEPVPGDQLSVLLGDFNSTLDHAPFRALVERGYRDAADATGAGLRTTWGPYEIRPVRLLTIDHVLADRRLGVAGLVVRKLPRSDHNALLATLIVPEASG